MTSRSALYIICTGFWSANKLMWAPASQSFATRKNWTCRFCLRNHGPTNKLNLQPPACGRSGKQKLSKTLDGPQGRGYNFWFFVGGDENSRHWQRRPRTRTYMEAAAIAACRPDFLRAGKCRDRRNCRKRLDSRQRFDGAR